ncbi:MAG: c-type cytochrome [Candidatus Acidiferrales bacterium]
MNRNNMSLRTATLAARTVAALLVLNASFALHGQESTASKNHKWDCHALTNVPQKTHARLNPLESDPEAVAAGRKLFEQHCAECHGMKAAGTKRAPSLLKPQVQQAPPGALFWILTNGVVRHGMPDWSKLPEPQRWQIITFLKSLKGSTDA